MPSLGSTARIIHTSDLPKKSGSVISGKPSGVTETAAITKPTLVNSNSGQIQSDLFKVGIAGLSVKLLPDNVPEKSSELFEDQFLTLKALINPESDHIKKAKQKSLDDILEMVRENQWDNIISIYYPVEEKNPELTASGVDLPIREKVAFALGQLNRFDEAIAELEICIRREPDNFYTRSSMAYTAYNSLFALKNREIMLTHQAKADRIALAHTNFAKAQHLRPDGITSFYRQAMLYSKIENRADKALPLFLRACTNWENLSDEQRSEHHQEKKNYIKSLYRLGSLLLTNGDAKRAMERITTCISLDENRNYISLTFKYFALGKIHFCLGDHQKAKDALIFALKSSSDGHDDFVVELLARTWLSLGESQRALEEIKKIPAKLRRPYFRWTEADVLCSLNLFKEAEQVLSSSLERDMRSKHKTLIRLTKIHYLQRDFEKAERCAAESVLFFRQQWGNSYNEGLFWQSLASFRMGRQKDAEQLAMELQENCSGYSKLAMLLATIRSRDTN